MPEYTMAMKRALKEAERLKPYPNIQYAVVQYPNMLTIRVFEDNIMEFSVDQRVNILEYLETLRKTIAAFGVECELEGVKGGAPRRRRVT